MFIILCLLIKYLGAIFILLWFLLNLHCTWIDIGFPCQRGQMLRVQQKLRCFHFALLNSSINRSFQGWYSCGLYYILLESKSHINIFCFSEHRVSFVWQQKSGMHLRYYWLHKNCLLYESFTITCCGFLYQYGVTIDFSNT